MFVFQLVLIFSFPQMRVLRIDVYFFFSPELIYYVAFAHFYCCFFHRISPISLDDTEKLGMKQDTRR